MRLKLHRTVWIAMLSQVTLCHLIAVSRSEKELPLPLPTDSLAYLLQTQCGPVDDPLVQELQAVFQDLLGLEYLPGPDTNFFNLGGSSMLASQLASRIRKRYEVPCSGAEVFHHATCNAMATMIRERREDSSGTSSQGDSSAAADTQGAPFPASRLDTRRRSCWHRYSSLCPFLW